MIDQECRAKEWPVDVRGGGATDSMNATWPFARLRADENCVDYTLLRKRYTLDKKDVVEISPYRYWLGGPGVRIVHRRSDLPILLLFYAWKHTRLMSALQNLGYTVKRTCSAV